MFDFCVSSFSLSFFAGKFVCILYFCNVFLDVLLLNLKDIGLLLDFIEDKFLKAPMFILNINIILEKLLALLA